MFEKFMYGDTQEDPWIVDKTVVWIPNPSIVIEIQRFVNLDNCLSHDQQMGLTDRRQVNGLQVGIVG